jgi:hypothetical protein
MKHVLRCMFALSLAMSITDVAHAQLPSLSFKAGLAVPLSDETDYLEEGFHLGAALKLPLIPLQFDASYDHMSGRGGGDGANILAGGAAMPFSLTPALLPVSIYLIAGGALYRVDSTITNTNFGLNGGAGVRVGIPLLKVFAEGRGVLVFSEGGNFTYIQAGVGLRF